MNEGGVYKFVLRMLKTGELREVYANSLNDAKRKALPGRVDLSDVWPFECWFEDTLLWRRQFDGDYSSE